MALKYWFSIIALLLFFTGCLQEDYLTPGEGKEHEIAFEFTIPESGKSDTRALTEAGEMEVNDMYVFIFKVAGSAQTLEYYTKATITGSAAGGMIKTGTFSLLRGQAGEKYKMVFIANAESEILSSASSLQAGTTYTDFLPILTKNITPILTTEPSSSFFIPMWGESKEVTISGTLSLTSAGEGAINMQRALAKVDVGININSSGIAEGLNEFELKEVTVYHVNNMARIVPDPATIGGDGYVNGVSIPGAAELKNVVRTITSGIHGAINSIYVPETPNHSSTTDANRPFIIVKGIYKGNDPGNPTDTYYRINFMNLDENMDWVEIMRNYSYTFNIKEVYREGYTTLQEAIDKLPLGLSYEFITGNSYYESYQFHIYNDVGYLSLTDKTALLSYTLTNNNSYIYYKREYKGDTNADIDGYFCDEDGNEVSQSRFTVTHTTYFRFSAVETNESDNEVFGYYKIFLKDYPEIGQIVKIIQRPPYIDMVAPYYNNEMQELFPGALYSDRCYLRILGVIPISNFRITCDGNIVASFTTNAAINNTMNGTSSPMFSIVNTDYFYRECKVEWQHPYSNNWIELGTFLQPGLNFRISGSTGCYVAARDCPINDSSTALYSTWSNMMGIADAYNTSWFNQNGQNYLPGGYWYPTTLDTGCAAYYENSMTDPVTGKGKWRVPNTEEMAEIAKCLYPTSYHGVSTGNRTTTGYYLTSEDASEIEYKSYRPVAGTPTQTATQKASYTYQRTRCVRDGE